MKDKEKDYISSFSIELEHYFIYPAHAFDIKAEDIKIDGHPIIPEVVGQLTVRDNRYIVIHPVDYKIDSAEKLQKDPADILTNRELQIIMLVAEGKPNKRIACQLNISEWTVSTHLRRIFAKLDVDSRAAMIYRCSKLIEMLKK